MSIPVTPSAPEAAVAFVERRFGEGLAKTLDPTGRAAAAREQRIIRLRRCGELRHAERYGWLSLAGWLLAMKVGELGSIDPTSPALALRAHAGDVLPVPLEEDTAPVLTTVADTGIEVSDPRDSFGFGVVALVAAALTDGVVEVGGRSLGGGAVAESLRARLKEASRV
jgi:hypothetical protein